MGRITCTAMRGERSHADLTKSVPGSPRPPRSAAFALFALVAVVLAALLGAAAAAKAPAPQRQIILAALPFACEMSDEAGEAYVYCWEGSPRPQRQVKLEPDGTVSQTASVPLPTGLGGPGSPPGGWYTVGPFRCEVLAQGIECVVIETGKGFLITRDNIVEVQAAAGVTEPSPVFGDNVTVRLSGGALHKAPGRKRFTVLTTDARLPLGTSFDTHRGRVELTAATPSGELQSGTFRGGIFRVTQEVTKSAVKGGASVGLTVLSLGGPLPPCGSGRAAISGKSGGRRLWGDAHGDFQTGGRYGSATVRGTKWLTADTCAGTKVTVARGEVAVEDFRAHRTVLVKAGHSYLADSGRQPAGGRRVDGIWMSGPGCGARKEFFKHPAEFPYFCDGAAIVEKAHWSNWGKPRATATAIFNEADLKHGDSVATAPRLYNPVKIVASHIGLCGDRLAYRSVAIRYVPPVNGVKTLKLGSFCG